MSDGKVERKKPSGALSFLCFFLRGYQLLMGRIPVFSNHRLRFTQYTVYFSLKSYPKCKWSLKPLQKTTRKAQSLLNPLGDQALLSESVSVCECACVGEVVWGGRHRQEAGERLHAVIVWKGFAMSLFLPPPLFLCPLSPCSSLCPLFLVPFFCICLGGSWSVLLIDSIFLWHLSPDWLKDLERKKNFN